MNDLTKILNNPEEHYPGNFDTPQRANALLTGLCQDAATEIAKLQAEVLEQCRVNGMSAEREDALRAELTRLKASIALDKVADNARELGLDYEPTPVQLDPKDWTPCMKLPVVVHVRQQRPGEAHVSTREGITPVKPDDLIMRGVSGEEYPIGRAIFEQTYTLDTTPQPAPVQPVALAKQILDAFPLFDDDGLDEEEHHCEWTLQQDRKRLHTMLTTPPAQPAVQEKCFLCGERVASCTSDVCPKSAQPAAQKGRDWSLLEATQESLREHMAEIKRLKAAQPAPVREIDTAYACGYSNGMTEGYEAGKAYAAQPAPVKTYHDGKPWPVAQPVVSLQCANCVVTIETLNDKVTQLMAAREPLTDAQILAANYPDGEENEATIAAPDVELIGFARAIEAKLKEKNT